MSTKTGSDTAMAEIPIAVTGMTCAACVNHVTKALEGVQGVVAVNVNLATESAIVRADSDRMDTRDLITAVEKSGYGVATEETALSIGGMTCASCVNHVQKALTSVEGVVEASINLATEQATLTRVAGTAALPGLREAVEASGYAVLGVTSSERPSAVSREHRQAERIRSLRLKVTVSIASAVLMMVAMRYTAIAPFEDISPTTVNLLMLALATPVQFWAGAQFYRGAWGALLHRTSNMNTLIAIGSSVAYLYSVAVTLFRDHVAQATLFPGHDTGTYFDVSAAIIGLILLGRYLEARAKGRTSAALKKLIGLQPGIAAVMRDGEPAETPIEEVMPGDEIMVRPGERVPVDGTVSAGTSCVDESLLTGESMPVDKEAGATVYAGTVNGTGSIYFVATRIGAETALAGIVRLVEQAQGSRAPIQRVVDVVTARFVPAVLGVAAMTFIVWAIIGPDPAPLNALLVSVAILVIACPCALGLATPTAVVVGMGRAAQDGILIRNAEALEIAHRIDTVILDKTGTITKGQPRVVSAHPFNIERNDLIALAAAVDRESEHPLAAAVVSESARLGVAVPEASGFQAMPGRGASARVGGTNVLVGSAAYMAESGVDTKQINDTLLSIAAEGHTPLIVARGSRLLGVIGVADTVKPGAGAAVSELRFLGIDVIMLTGDTSATAQAIARQVGIETVIAEVLPSDKAEQISEIQRQGRVVAMVGDGLNDAPALALANVGIAIGSGADVAIEAADVTIVGSDVRDVPWVIALSKATMRTIRQNLFWAFFYNVALIPIAAGVLYPVFSGSGVPAPLQPILGEQGFLNPIAAAAAMAFSSMSVVTNSLRLNQSARRRSSPTPSQYAESAAGLAGR